MDTTTVQSRTCHASLNSPSTSLTTNNFFSDIQQQSLCIQYCSIPTVRIISCQDYVWSTCHYFTKLRNYIYISLKYLCYSRGRTDECAIAPSTHTTCVQQLCGELDELIITHPKTVVFFLIFHEHTCTHMFRNTYEQFVLIFCLQHQIFPTAAITSPRGKAADNCNNTVHDNSNSFIC